MPEPRRSHYEILGVHPGATEADIRKAWLKAVRRVHPDSLPREEHTEATRRTAALNDAYSVLRDREKRAEYDRRWGSVTIGPRVEESMTRLRRRMHAQRRATAAGVMLGLAAAAYTARSLKLF